MKIANLAHSLLVDIYVSQHEVQGPGGFPDEGAVFHRKVRPRRSVVSSPPPLSFYLLLASSTQEISDPTDFCCLYDLCIGLVTLRVKLLL